MIEWPSIEPPPATQAGYELPIPETGSEEVDTTFASLPVVPPLELLPKASDKTFAPLRATPHAVLPVAVAVESSGDKLNVQDNNARDSTPVKGTDDTILSPAPTESPAQPKGVQHQSLAAETGQEKAGEDAEAAAGPGVQELSFMRAARRRAFWRKPGVRAMLSVLFLVALALLAAQVAVQERDDLAARVPALRPGLQALCGQVGCVLAPRRDIAAVEVDSSSFQKLRGDEYRFSLVLKNRSAIPVAMPAVELTLTDATDQPVLRRVLMPEQWNAPQELAAQGEWIVSRTLVLNPAGARITGYRVVAFYP